MARRVSRLVLSTCLFVFLFTCLFHNLAAAQSSSVIDLTDTNYFTAHLDYLQVYPGNPIDAMATIRVRLK